MLARGSDFLKGLNFLLYLFIIFYIHLFSRTNTFCLCVKCE